jgi:zinc transport system substrate-binding protein
MKIACAIVLCLLSSTLGARTLVVSLSAYREVAQALAGPRWEVMVALPKGGDHENFAPTPGHMRLLYGADLYWASGMGFERRLVPALQKAGTALQVIQAEDSCTAEHHDHSGHHHHDHDDLHRWLDPTLVMQDADLVTAALIALDPPAAEEYRQRNAAFKVQGERLATELREVLEPFAGEPIFVYHAAFGRFAEAFGLEQVALERDGREPSLRELSDLTKRARAAGAAVVYVQPQYRRSSAEALARALEARVVEVDPMAEDWADNLRRLARQFAQDLQARKERAG